MYFRILGVITMKGKQAMDLRENKRLHGCDWREEMEGNIQPLWHEYNTRRKALKVRLCW